MAFGKKNNRLGDSSKDILPCGAVTMISVGTVVEGILKLGGDLRVDGEIHGNIHGDKRVVIGEKGMVKGDVFCEFLELHGKVEGNITAKQSIRLHGTAMLVGDLNAPQFSIDMGATFIGASTGQKKNLTPDANNESNKSKK